MNSFTSVSIITLAIVCLLSFQKVGLGNNYGEDLAFLKKHTNTIELSDGQARLVIVPDYQARVMTSTVNGLEGDSFGWINYELIQQGILSEEQSKGRLESKIYVFGGEERFWLGPEGGQYGIFFEPGSPFDFDHWKTPPPIDTEAFQTIKTSVSEAHFSHEFSVTNHSGTRFDLKVERTVRLLSPQEAQTRLGLEEAPAKMVAYETVNKLINRGAEAWKPETGLLSIWLLGMYKPTPQTVVAIPFKEGPETELGPVVKGDYFGQVPSDRLKIENGVIYFKGDGRERGKIGVSPKRSLGVAGSYSPELKALTIVHYDLPEEILPYVNSTWETQDLPYSGDAINAYNDGSPAPGEPPLGPFYELETSSQAAALAPGESIVHIQMTCHIVDEPPTLDRVATETLGATLKSMLDIFN